MYISSMVSACLGALSASNDVFTPAAERVLRVKAPQERAPLPIALTSACFLQETWPGVDQTGNGGTGTAQDVRQGVGQTAAPSPGKPVSLPGTGTEKATDASRLVDAPPTFQNTGMVLSQLPGHGPAAVVPHPSYRARLQLCDSCMLQGNFYNLQRVSLSHSMAGLGHCNCIKCL